MPYLGTIKFDLKLLLETLGISLSHHFLKHITSNVFIPHPSGFGHVDDAVSTLAKQESSFLTHWLWSEWRAGLLSISIFKGDYWIKTLVRTQGDFPVKTVIRVICN